MILQAKKYKKWCLDIKIAPNLWYNKIATIQIIQRRGADLMINQMSQNENTKNQFSNAIKKLQVGKLLRKANITKSCGISAYEVFQFLPLLVFQGKNLFRFLNSKRKELAVSKNTYYRFLNDTSFNWARFLSLLSAKVASRFSALTRPERVKVLVLDDSMVKRNRSKAVELLVRVYDHVEHKYQIQRALAAGIQADYVLMDTWFTTEPMLAKILETGLDVIGMVKQLKQRYSYQGRLYTLPELRRFVRFITAGISLAQLWRPQKPGSR